MKLVFAAIISALLFDASPSMGQAESQPKVPPAKGGSHIPDPGPHPPWADVNATAIRLVRGTLIDQNSLILVWTSGFQWGYIKNVMEKRQYGWIACGKYNAKNRMGGYVGFSNFIILVDDKSVVHYQEDHGDSSDTLNLISYKSTCLDGQLVDVNPELHGVDPSAPTPAAPTSVADEIAKLAALRDKGVITQAEFDTQKAKLLAP